MRVLTGLGEGAFYSNDRSLIAEETPQEKRSLGMGVVITGLALGITIATVFAPEHDRARRQRVRRRRGWRMPFLLLGAATLVVGIARRGLLPPPGAGPAVRPRDAAPDGLLGASASPRSWPSTSSATRPGLSDLWIALLEVALALVLVAFVFTRASGETSAPVLRNRDLVLINLAFIAVLWNLWFFGFWSVSIVADAAGSSFGRSAMIAAFNAGAGILGFPVGGWLSDVAVRRGIGRKPLRDRLHRARSSC